MAEKKIVFADNTDLVIREESTPTDQIVAVAEWADIEPILARFTRANLASWHYTLNGIKSSEDFTNYRFVDVRIVVGDTFEVHVHTEAIPEIELINERIAAINLSNELQNEVLDFLLMEDFDEEYEDEEEEETENEDESTEEGAESEGE